MAEPSTALGITPREALGALLLREERAFCELFGGYAVELPGAVLVVNEKVPVPRFNWVQNVRCADGRVAALLEQALQHYYQRALRPTFELPVDLPQAHLARGLLGQGYHDRGASRRRHLLVWEGAPRPRSASSSGGLQVEPLEEEHFGQLVDLLAEERFKEELHRYLVTATTSPNPGERTVPYWARDPEGPVSFGLYHRQGPVSALFGVGTVPARRGAGAATALVAGVLEREKVDGPLLVASEGAHPPAPLLKLGFELWGSYEVYALTDEAARQGF